MKVEHVEDTMDVVDFHGKIVAPLPADAYCSVTYSGVRTLDIIEDILSYYGKQLVSEDIPNAFDAIKLLSDTLKDQEEKEKEDMQRVTVPMPTRMLKNGRATVVFFADDTKVVVKLPDGVEDNEYNAFCAAIAKKMFGTNTRIKRKMEFIREVAPTKDERREVQRKAREDAEAKRKDEIDKKVRRMAHEMVLEKRANALAEEIMEGYV